MYSQQRGHRNERDVGFSGRKSDNALTHVHEASTETQLRTGEVLVLLKTA